eukprot:9600072-Alexandrium_andersonii.AAC.1
MCARNLRPGIRTRSAHRPRMCASCAPPAPGLHCWGAPDAGRFRVGPFGERGPRTPGEGLGQHVQPGPE